MAGPRLSCDLQTPGITGCQVFLSTEFSIPLDKLALRQASDLSCSVLDFSVRQQPFLG